MSFSVYGGSVWKRGGGRGVSKYAQHIVLAISTSLDLLSRDIDMIIEITKAANNRVD